MKKQEQERVAAGYNAALRRIRNWIVASGIVAPASFLTWKVLVPHFPEGVRHWALYASVTSTMLAASWFLVSWILLATYAHEKRSRLSELE